MGVTVHVPSGAVVGLFCSTAGPGFSLDIGALLFILAAALRCKTEDVGGEKTVMIKTRKKQRHLHGSRRMSAYVIAKIPPYR